MSLQLSEITQFRNPKKRRPQSGVKDLDRTQSVAHESAILVNLVLPEYESTIDPLDELEGLAETAGTQVVGRLSQQRAKPDATTYLGKGKVEELARFVDSLGADVVIFDNDLSPAQVRNLEQAVNVKVLDRTELILDIFATHAQTYESRLAVELAQLEYSFPRLKRMWTHLSRMKMGVGMRGPGEKQLEEDRRLVERRIVDLRRELQAIERRRERQVSARRDQRTVSLVGYTNAGKSTLMNALTDADVLAEDKLFATLDTRTRRWRLPHWGPILLSDTVGFIKNLPHRLIASFKATLEEAHQADLLMHVADASSPAVYEHISAVYSVLEGLEIQEKDSLLVINKCDAISSRGTLDGILNRYPNAIAVSAVTGEGLDRLAAAVSQLLSKSFCDLDVETDVSDGRLMAFLADRGEVLSRRYHDERVTIHCRIPQKYIGRIEGEGVEIRPHEGNGQAKLGHDAETPSENDVEDVA